MSGRLRDDYDVIVVGTGVAGLSTALPLAAHRRVGLITAGMLGGGSTALAQGGVAAALDVGDDPRLHAADTITAGAGLCDPAAVGRLTADAPGRVAELIDLGARFDLATGGTIDLTREGGHRCQRVVHAGGDATGAEVSRALVEAVRAGGTRVIEHSLVTDLHMVMGRFGPQVGGVVVRRDGESKPVIITAREVVLATGGVGGLFETTTNPDEVTGAGLALALRAGAALADVEFVQFHPTGFRADRHGRVPLISEALRGEGAILRDLTGRAVMAGVHPMADLAPRDVVARRITEVMSERVDGRPNLVALDVSGIGDEFSTRFPTAYRTCLDHGIDPTRELIPVTPTQHFLCGGVQTDIWGRTTVRGLSGVGEVAATGVHGANRLASNSLVEGMAFGRRVADRLASDRPERATTVVTSRSVVAVDALSVARIRAVMSSDAGVVRSGERLAAAAAALDAMPVVAAEAGDDDASLRWLAARAIVAAATERRESRGCHWRSDYSSPDESWRHRLLVTLDDDGAPQVSAVQPLDRSA